ncbi:hypothetical protein T10_8226 [Trichinella papuae]|uniref:Uncharacterized protein n=1 Tax=Trichinella papuae TaxID=268474 RepID=A0A0V1LYJ6_9BILA|nr:hypothetical protein T10_8226 [Trichinella papuae]
MVSILNFHNSSIKQTNYGTLILSYIVVIGYVT